MHSSSSSCLPGHPSGFNLFLQTLSLGCLGLGFAVCWGTLILPGPHLNCFQCPQTCRRWSPSTQAIPISLTVPVLISCPEERQNSHLEEIPLIFLSFFLVFPFPQCYKNFPLGLLASVSVLANCSWDHFWKGLSYGTLVRAHLH